MNHAFDICFFKSLRGVILFAALAFSLAVPSQASAQVSALKDHDTAQAIDITADRLEVREKEDIAVFSGSVEAVQGELNISADSITVYYKKPVGDGNPTISRLDMAGHAKLVSPSEEVSSDWAVYDVEARLVTLGGSVVLGSGDSQVRGERLELDLESGITRFEGAPVVGAGVGTGPGGDEPTGRVRGRFSVPDSSEDAGEETSEEKKEDVPKDENN